MGEKKYFKDRDYDWLIVRVWYDEKGNKRGESWNYTDKKWVEDDKLAWMVADDIYENYPLGEDDVEKIVGVNVE